jgi:hypothetical protein
LATGYDHLPEAGARSSSGATARQWINATKGQRSTTWKGCTADQRRPHLDESTYRAHMRSSGWGNRGLRLQIFRDTHGTSTENRCYRIISRGAGMTRFPMAVLLSCWLCGTAFAADVKIGDTPLRLPQPTGYCEMDPVLASDTPLIGRLHATMAKAGNHLLVMSADCTELRDWRNGKRPDFNHFAQYQTTIAFENETLPESPDKMIHNYCGNMTALGDQAMPGTSRDVNSRAEQSSKTIALNDLKFLGVLAEDPLVCYAATLNKFEVKTHEETMQAGIIATTILKDKIVLYYLFAPYVGRETFIQLLAKHRTNVSELQRANRN